MSALTVRFLVVSRVGGYDAPIKHLQASGLSVERLRMEPAPATPTESIDPKDLL